MSEVVEKQNLQQKLIAFFDAWVLFSFSDKLKFAIKVSLSLMLAYMIPLGMGWSQPNTAAMTVMLIATAGAVSESVMKGMIRVIGTLLGAVIGLVLIGMFPQDRMSYLFIVSILVPLMLYMYHVYQGDGTVFMLMGITVMTVFNGGEVDDAFLYGIDKTYMTVFGIVIYTLVGLFVWPIKQEDTTISDALELTGIQQDVFENSIDHQDDKRVESLLNKARSVEQKLQHSYVQGSGTSLAMTLSIRTWKSISGLYNHINGLLSMLSIHMKENELSSYGRYIKGYDDAVEEIKTLFAACARFWKDERAITLPQSWEADYEMEALSNLQRSAVITHAALLKNLHKSLCDLADSLNTLRGGEEILIHQKSQTAAKRFVWLDPEYLKGVIQTFLIFWFSTAMWIYFNPPGGFMMVALATLFSTLTSFSSLRPSILALLFSMGFLFATAMYVLVLPNLVYDWQLALFIFLYSFIAFYFINSQISIFFLMGLYTLGIANTMYYDFAIFLNILLFFYLFLSILMLFYYLPFSTKPEHLFLVMKKRLFAHATALLQDQTPIIERAWIEQKVHNYHREHLVRTAQKLKLWASQIDLKYFNTISSENLSAFATACEVFSNKLELQVQYEERLKNSTLYTTVEPLREYNVLAELSAAMMVYGTENEEASIFLENEHNRARLEAKINTFKEDLQPKESSKEALTEVYITLALRHSVWMALSRCYEAGEVIDFKALQKSRF